MYACENDKCLIETIVSEKLQIKGVLVYTTYKISLSIVAAAGTTEAITISCKALAIFSYVKHALYIIIILCYAYMLPDCSIRVF